MTSDSWPRVATAARETTRPIDERWGPGPRHPQLAAGSVQVWLADLASVADEVLESLSLDERRRAAHFPGERRGLLWARARGVLRALLGSYLEVDPASVGLRLEGRGKPTVAMPRRSLALSFNLSHSGTLGLYAFAEDAAVGIDIQVARARRLDEIALARRAWGQAEALRLEDLEPVKRQAEFLRAWTRHEAIAKCIGTGLGGRLPTSRAGGGVYRAPVHQATVTPPDGHPWVAQLELGPGAAAAVAIRQRPHELLRWAWLPQPTTRHTQLVA